MGLEGVPEAGDKLNRVESAEVARSVAEHRSDLKRRRAKVILQVTLEDDAQDARRRGR